MDQQLKQQREEMDQQIATIEATKEEMDQQLKQQREEMDRQLNNKGRRWIKIEATKEEMGQIEATKRGDGSTIEATKRGDGSTIEATREEMGQQMKQQRAKTKRDVEDVEQQQPTLKKARVDILSVEGETW